MDAKTRAKRQKRSEDGKFSAGSGGKKKKGRKVTTPFKALMKNAASHKPITKTGDVRFARSD